MKRNFQREEREHGISIVLKIFSIFIKLFYLHDLKLLSVIQ